MTRKFSTDNVRGVRDKYQVRDVSGNIQVKRVEDKNLHLKLILLSLSQKSRKYLFCSLGFTVLLSIIFDFPFNNNKCFPTLKLGTN